MESTKTLHHHTTAESDILTVSVHNDIGAHLGVATVIANADGNDLVIDGTTGQVFTMIDIELGRLNVLCQRAVDHIAETF